MALDPTAREANFMDSIRKFFVDEVETANGILVTFDTFFDAPKFKNREHLRWLSVNLGLMNRGFLSEISLDLFCCVREDPEGFRLAQFSDLVMGLLSDTTQTDGMKRIPFYRSYADKAWELLGQFLVIDVIDGERNTAEDQTKYKQLTVLLKVASKV
jgi:hypothetical protein